MNKLPWMKYDPDIISMDVDGMSLTEEGAYSRAVRHIWRNGPLPKDRLQRLCGACFDVVFSCMVEVDGAWTLQWLEDARNDASNRQSKASKAGKASAEKRSTNVEHELNVSSTNVLSLSNSLSTSTSENGKEKKGEDAKEDFKAKCAQAVEALKEPMPKEERAAFFDHWTESDANGKMRFQGEKYFGHAKRMAQWMRNAKKFASNGKPAAPLPSPTLKPWMQ